MRPENVAQVQADIDEQVAQVNEEKRIAERQRVNEEANERAQAAANAEAVADSVDGWIDNIVNAHAEVLREKENKIITLETNYARDIETLEANHAQELFTTRRYYRV